MAKRKRLLTATLSDGYVKTIGPTAAPFTHYWRIVAVTEAGGTEVFWGHSNSLREANGGAPPPPTPPGSAAGPATISRSSSSSKADARGSRMRPPPSVSVGAGGIVGTAIASEYRDLSIEHAVVVDIDRLGGGMVTRNSDILRPRGHFERLRLSPHRHSRLTPPRH